MVRQLLFPALKNDSGTFYEGMDLYKNYNDYIFSQATDYCIMIDVIAVYNI